MSHVSRHVDAIVVGAGAAGGTAAACLADAGLRVLVLDAGMPSSPIRRLSRKLAHRACTALLGVSRVQDRLRQRQPIQAHCYAWSETPDAFLDDIENPYEVAPEEPFVWIRSRQLGGRMVVPGHGRQYYRLGEWDLHTQDGASPAWPLTYQDLAPWYSAVERRLQMAGGREGLPWLPDSDLHRELAPAAHEAAAVAAIRERWANYRPVLGRFSAPFDLVHQAVSTGRITIKQGAVVRSVEVESAGRVKGVCWVDAASGRLQRLDAPLVFLCASALESTRILMLSQGPDGREGIGAGSGVLGHNLMDHVLTTMEAIAEQRVPASIEAGRCLYLPRFDARSLGDPRPGRGFGVQLYFFQPRGEARAFVSAAAFGEMLPRHDNRVALHPTRRDRWGIPVLQIRCLHGTEEVAMGQAQRFALQELADVLQLSIIRMDDQPRPPGSAIHECGTARMGDDPATSVLNRFNECWEAQGLYVTDGACLPSQGAANPTLVYMALTARACAHATGTLVEADFTREEVSRP